MTPRDRLAPLHRALLAALVLAAFATVGPTETASAAGPAMEEAPETTSQHAARAKETLQRIRDAGTALFSWVTDAAGDQKWPQGGEDDESEKTVDWSRCSEIDRDELRELLVPDYIPELPTTDGWGNPLELCLDRDPTPPETFLAGIRSPGRDGVFEGETYTVGGFPSGDFDRDVVWIDGFFVAWPSGDDQ